MSTTGAHTNRGVTLSQQAPLFVSIDQNAPLIEDSIQKEGRSDLNAPQFSDVNPAATKVLQPNGELGRRRRTLDRERDQ